MSDERLEREAGASRRALLAGAGAVGATAVLAACGAGDSPNNAPSPPAEGPAGEPRALVTTEQVEVGGGVIVDDKRVVVTQPTEGVFKGFSAVCTHQGCTVTAIAAGTIDCACHGSKFSIEDGTVVRAANGGDPSRQPPLPAVDIEVDGAEIWLA